MPVIGVFQKGILPDRYRECGFEAILAEYSSEPTWPVSLDCGARNNPSYSHSRPAQPANSAAPFRQYRPNMKSQSFSLRFSFGGDSELASHTSRMQLNAAVRG